MQTINYFIQNAYQENKIMNIYKINNMGNLSDVKITIIQTDRQTVVVIVMVVVIIVVVVVAVAMIKSASVNFHT